MRQLKPGQKAKIKAVKEKRGFGAAIDVARQLTGRAHLGDPFLYACAAASVLTS